MFEKLEIVEKRYDELTLQIGDPKVISNNNEWRKLVKEHSLIEDIVIKYRLYNNIIAPYEYIPAIYIIYRRPIYKPSDKWY